MIADIKLQKQPNFIGIITKKVWSWW